MWPVVSPDKIVVAESDWDLAYMGVYLRLEICNRSPFLVREAELRIDGRGAATPGVVTSREIKVGPLFPGVYVHEEVGIGAQGGISGVSFDTVAVHAVRLTPPDQMVPAAEYPDLTAEILEVAADQEAPDLRRPEDDGSEDSRTVLATAIRIRVRNGGRAVVERTRLKLKYFGAADEGTGGPAGPHQDLGIEWIFDMPQRKWNPYRLPDRLDAACDPADPLPSGQSYEFIVVHYNGGPHGWAGNLDATAVEVCELRLRV
jgi:hypothetical protein